MYGPCREKPVFRVSDKARFKPVSSATEASSKIEMLLVAGLDIIISKKRITKALTRLRGAHVFFAAPKTGFLASGPNYIFICFVCTDREWGLGDMTQGVCHPPQPWKNTRGYRFP